MSVSFQSIANYANIALKHLTLNPYTLSLSVGLSYIAFYTGYDKVTKSIKLQNLSDLVLLSRGVDWTLVELNKAISLTGLTTLLLSFLPCFKETRSDLTWISMNMLWGHTAYSLYKFYGFSFEKILKDKDIKKLSILLGNLGQLALSFGYWGYISELNLIVSATILSISHFWTMEVDYKYKLQVRPYAYLPFPLAIAVLYYVYKQPPSGLLN